MKYALFVLSSLIFKLIYITILSVRNHHHIFMSPKILLTLEYIILFHITKYINIYAIKYVLYNVSILSSLCNYINFISSVCYYLTDVFPYIYNIYT